MADTGIDVIIFGLVTTLLAIFLGAIAAARKRERDARIYSWFATVGFVQTLVGGVVFMLGVILNLVTLLIER